MFDCGIKIALVLAGSQPLIFSAIIYYSVFAVRKWLLDSLASYFVLVFTFELHSIENLVGMYFCYFYWKIEVRWLDDL